MNYFCTVHSNTNKSDAAYIAWEELDNHPNNECSPEDVQGLEHEHQPVEEVEAEEGRVEGQRVHPRRVNDPAAGQRPKQRNQSEPHTVTIKRPLRGTRTADREPLVMFPSNCSQALALSYKTLHND